MVSTSHHFLKAESLGQLPGVRKVSVICIPGTGRWVRRLRFLGSSSQVNAQSGPLTGLSLQLAFSSPKLEHKVPDFCVAEECERSSLPQPPFPGRLRVVKKNRLWCRTDLISLHMPVGPEMRYLISQSLGSPLVPGG